MKGISRKDEIGRMYLSKENQDIVRLLLKLKAFEIEYPLRMFTTRRSSFIMLLARYLYSWMKVF